MCPEYSSNKPVTPLSPSTGVKTLTMSSNIHSSVWVGSILTCHNPSLWFCIAKKATKHILLSIPISLHGQIKLNSPLQPFTIFWYLSLFKLSVNLCWYTSSHSTQLSFFLFCHFANNLAPFIWAFSPLSCNPICSAVRSLSPDLGCVSCASVCLIPRSDYTTSAR